MPAVGRLPAAQVRPQTQGGPGDAAGFAALLALGTAVSTWQAVRATQAEAVALANEQRDNEHATQAEKERDEVRAL